MREQHVPAVNFGETLKRTGEWEGHRAISQGSVVGSWGLKAERNRTQRLPSRLGDLAACVPMSA